MNTHEAGIVAAARTPVGKARKGGLATVRPDELAALVIKELLERAPGLDPATIDDVILGCAFPEGEQGLNFARTVALRAGLPDVVSGETINRYCSSGSQSIAHAAFASKTICLAMLRITRGAVKWIGSRCATCT